MRTVYVQIPKRPKTCRNPSVVEYASSAKLRNNCASNLSEPSDDTDILVSNSFSNDSNYGISKRQMSHGAAIFRDHQQVLPLKRPMGGQSGRRLLEADWLDQFHDVLHPGSHQYNDRPFQRHARGASYRVCVSPSVPRA